MSWKLMFECKQCFLMLFFVKKKKKIKSETELTASVLKKISKTHVRLNKCFLIRGNRRNRQNVLFRLIKKRSFNLLCVLVVFCNNEPDDKVTNTHKYEQWTKTLFLFSLSFFLFPCQSRSSSNCLFCCWWFFVLFCF